MEVEEIKEDKAFKKIFLKKNRAKSTYINYTKVLKKFCKFTGLSPTELVKQAKEEQIAYINNKNQIIIPEIEDTQLAQNLENYYKNEMKRGLNPNSIKTELVLLRTFYTRNDVKNLPSPIEIEKTQTEIRILKKEKIKRAIEKSRTKGKAIISFMASTGIRSVDIRHLKIRHLLKALNIETIHELLNNEEQIIGYWEFKPIKTKKQGNICKVCNSPESTEHIIKYLNTRREAVTEDNYIFASNLGGKFSARGFVTFFKTLDNKLYKEDKIWLKKQLNNGKISQERYDYEINHISRFHAHGLRKYFINTISSHSGNIKIIRKMSGHSSPEPNDSSYVNIEQDIIEKNYFAMLHYLTFGNTKIRILDDKGTKKLKEVEKEYKKLETENKLLKDNQQSTNDRVALIESILEDVDHDKLKELLNQE